jgi:GNAT superfamily N-acetyltransferase
MTVRIEREPLSHLAEYARVSIAFDVHETLEVSTSDFDVDGHALRGRPVRAPYVKDYDRVPGNHPTEWLRRFDMRAWAILAAWDCDTRVGGAVVVWNTPGVDMLEGRSDLAVLWDLRVAPVARGRGIGSALFRAAESWAAGQGAHWLEAETQNVNVGACRFYTRQGCTLGAVHRFAYPELPDEVQLLWYKDLRPPISAG